MASFHRTCDRYPPAFASRSVVLSRTRAHASIDSSSIVTATLLFVILLIPSPLPTPLPTSPPAPIISQTANYLGLAATALVLGQYLPQLLLTWQDGFIGALSITTMAIQVPGSAAFVVSIAMREGTDWSSWIPYVSWSLDFNRRSPINCLILLYDRL